MHMCAVNSNIVESAIYTLTYTYNICIFTFSDNNETLQNDTDQREGNHNLLCVHGEIKFQ